MFCSAACVSAAAALAAIPTGVVVVQVRLLRLLLLYPWGVEGEINPTRAVVSKSIVCNNFLPFEID
jgi:hypothetical protein